MKKIIITVAFVAIVCCLLAFSVSAETMSYYCTAKVTLTDNTQMTVYFPCADYSVQRNVIYKTTDKAGETLSWNLIKELDFRDAVTMYNGEQIYNSPTGWTGISLAGKPSNVTTVHLPKTMTYLASSSFTSDWSALDTVYIPASVEDMGDAFMGSPIKTVVFEKGSCLRTFSTGAPFVDCTSLSNINLEDTSLVDTGFTTSGRGAFRNCTSLTTIKLPETLTSIGYNCFYLSGLSGTVRVPDSVTYVGPGAFLSTKVETLILGDGPITIGHNFIGTYNSTSNQYLKEVYIPVGAKIEKSSTWFKCANLVTFYVIGEEGQDCSETVAELKKSSGGNYMTFATEEEAKTAEEGSYDAIIKLGYNKCVAFYGSEHVEQVDNTCETENLCNVCKIVITEANQHAEGVVIDYPNGFAQKGIKTIGCKNPGCTILDEEKVANSMFTASGYSTAPNGNSISVGYSISINAYEDYISSGKTLKFGVIIVNPSSVIQGQELFVDGELNTQKGIQVEMNKLKYSHVNCYVRNFTDKTIGMELVFALYIIDGNGEVSYIQSDSSYNSQIPIGTTVLSTVSLQRILAVAQAPAVFNGKENGDF